jgi:hypothetical protein
MSNTLPITSFGAEFSSFLKSNIRQRDFIFKTGKSQRNDDSMRSALLRLIPYTYTKFADQGAASFIIKFYNDIFTIIPANQHKQICKLYSFLLTAKSIIQ